MSVSVIFCSSSVYQLENLVISKQESSKELLALLAIIIKLIANYFGGAWCDEGYCIGVQALVTSLVPTPLVATTYNFLSLKFNLVISHT